MHIQRATEQAVLPLLQAAIDDVTASAGVVPVLLSDSDEIKPQMPYIVAFCPSNTEIAPGCGIFEVDLQIEFRSHTKETEPGQRDKVLGAINNFAYDDTAAKLSAADGYHCHGFYYTGGTQTVDTEKKAIIHIMKYRVACMAMDEPAS